MESQLTSTVPRTERGRRTRERVLASATGLMRERGVAGVTLDAVEAASGVGRGQLYHYFAGRDDLVRSVVDHIVDLVLGGSAEQLADLDSLPGIERWFTRAETLCGTTSGVGGCPIGSLVGQLAERDEASRVALADAFGRWEAPLLAGLGRMRDRGELRAEVRLDALADLVMAALQGGLLLAQVRRDPAQLRHALDGARLALRAAMTG